jgi:hypothetical protein
MHSFSQFGIKVVSKCFVGDKIKMSKILNKEIVVHDFKIMASTVDAFKAQGSDKCLHLQISLNNEKYIVFTSSGFLMDAIEQIPEDGFPFATVIIQDEKRLQFT